MQDTASLLGSVTPNEARWHVEFTSNSNQLIPEDLSLTQSPQRWSSAYWLYVHTSALTPDTCQQFKNTTSSIVVHMWSHVFICDTEQSASVAFQPATLQEYYCSGKEPTDTKSKSGRVGLKQVEQMQNKISIRIKSQMPLKLNTGFLQIHMVVLYLYSITAYLNVLLAASVW